MSIITPLYARDCQPLTMTTHGGQIIARAECSSCGGHHEIKRRDRPFPITIKKQFSNKGWTLGRKPKCPMCFKAKEAPMTAKPAAPSVDVREQRRNAHMLLECEFDIAKGAFKNGYSDERIAKETGISLEWVKKRREDEFGPLKAPNELTALRQQLHEAQAQVSALQERFNSLCLKQGWAA